MSTILVARKHGEREEHWKKIGEQVKGEKMKELLVVRKHGEREEH